jgi:S1-C subfamily serine protease
MCRRLTTGLALLGLLMVVSPAPAQPAQAVRLQPRVYLGVTVDTAKEEHGGAVIREVTQDSPAMKAGLKAGDVVVKVGDRDVKAPEDLISAVAQHKSGDKLNFHIKREGHDQDVSVTLAERPAGGERSGGFLGVVTHPMTPGDKSRLGVSADQGLVIAEVMPDSPATKADLRRGDVITAVGGQAVADPGELRQMVQQTGAGKDVKLSVLRGHEKKEVQARLEEPPVDGITSPLLPPFGRPFTSRFQDPAEKIAELERRLTDLERRVRELEQKRR